MYRAAVRRRRRVHPAAPSGRGLLPRPEADPGVPPRRGHRDVRRGGKRDAGNHGRGRGAGELRESGDGDKTRVRTVPAVLAGAGVEGDKVPVGGGGGTDCDELHEHCEQLLQRARRWKRREDQDQVRERERGSGVRAGARGCRGGPGRDRHDHEGRRTGNHLGNHDQRGRAHLQPPSHCRCGQDCPPRAPHRRVHHLHPLRHDILQRERGVP
mmetsp:Transcript_3674/g.7630  ORF Transcript_3674/g.7630 Transcript_3674/m.7630 type:complete len:212 (-) Transcript_3674:597-1232(-)